MDTEVSQVEPETVAAAALPECTSAGMEPLEALNESFGELKETLADIECIGGPEIARKTRKMAVELDHFAPSVTFIGQIKSGKTSLVNAMAGRPGLLPADVNPWTSVVTSLHLNAARGKNGAEASFTFFDADEWDHLVNSGGRIGQLSARVGADKEFEKLQAQITRMRDKTRARLGRNFELMLGQTHDYRHLDQKLVQRYVCLGDDFDTLSAEEKQGYFADITKSADLYLDAPHLPHGLCLRDTPGLNDTFMMREQVTIQSIRDSRICVVVLSAHQALNTVDMGIIRLISNVKHRQVVLFVNRIDELADPVGQVPEIRESLVRTLADNGGPEDPCIVFGSALWANAVLENTVGDLPEASIEALENWGCSGLVVDVDEMEEEEAVWALSGLPALYTALGERIAESAGRKMLTSVRKRAANLVSGLRASCSIISLRANGDQIRKLDNDQVAALLNGIEEQAIANMFTALDDVFDGFARRVDQAHARFITRALDSLIQHLEVNGEDEVWSYSADGLRMLVRTAYHVMRKSFTARMEGEFAQVAERLTHAYGEIFDVTNENFEVEVPGAPEVPAPVSLAQTIVLDVKTSWWKGWWARRKGYASFAANFREMIEAESTPMVESLKIGQINEIRSSAEKAMRDFLTEQRGVLADICEKSQVSLEDLHGLFGVSSQEEREELFDLIYEELDLQMPELGEAA